MTEFKERLFYPHNFLWTYNIIKKDKCLLGIYYVQNHLLRNRGERHNVK